MHAPRLRRVASGCLALALGACADSSRVAAPQPPNTPAPNTPAPNTPERSWTFVQYPADGGPPVAADSGTRTGGEVHVFHEFGFDRLSVGGGRVAFGEVFSTADGKSYAVSTEDADGLHGTSARLEQAQSFRKKPGQATLTLHVTQIELLGINQNRDPACLADAAVCPARTMAGVTFVVMAYDGGGHFFNRGSSAFLVWQRNTWQLLVPSQIAPFWSAGNFAPTFHIEDAKVTLAGTVAIPVDLSSVRDGEEFTLRVRAEATTYNIDGRESFSSAYFRDPLSLDGGTLEFEGLEPTNRPLPEPPAGTLGAAPACATPRPGAGALQFAAPEFHLGETPFGGADGVVVTRTGGTSGAVSATFTTSNGTAVAGTDYQAVTTTVAFADGDAGPRTVPIPVLGNARIESDRTVNLALSDPRGCATLGPAASVLTIHDDDAPPPPSAFRVGGTVTGLAGSGLVLRNDPGGEELAVGANGAFTFTRPTPTGIDYRVVVATQPANPAQVCTVASGAGTMAGAPVTDVAVTCTTPAPVGGLDPAFGTGGKVATPLNGEAEAVVVQPDGKIVVAGHSTVTTVPGTGGSADFTVLRYNADGSPDAGFGMGGVATAGFPAGRTDEALDVALQPDGRIVVVGTTQLSVAAGGEVDFGVARFTADGRLDTSFGAGGIVSTDFGPGSALAQGVAVQPDGRIVVVGSAKVGAGNDFALARYNADGTPDATFGTAGRVTTNVVGRADLGMAVALAPGGKIVVAGRAEQSDGRGDDLGLARYNADGTLDPSFGAGGLVTTDVGGGTQQANDVVVLADGRIVVAGYSGLGGTGSFDFVLARYHVDGRLDTGFGAGGTVATDLSGRDDFAEGLAVQADGKLVVVGRQTSAATFSDLALARYTADGTPDASFGAAGRLAVDFFGGEDLGQGVAVQSDGKIVGAGHARNGTARNVVLVRVRP